MNYFDQEAATWDDNPQRLEIAKAIYEKIKIHIPISPEWSVFDYGCGTGTLSFFLHKQVKSILLADESQGMLDMLNKKIILHQADNMKAVKLDLTKENLENNYNMVYTLMALHHIRDVETIIKKFYSVLYPGGYLCIGDLVKEDGSLHAHHDHFDGHNGFDLSALEKNLQKAGFKNIQTRIAFEMIRETDQNIRKYPVFLMYAQK